MKTQNRHASRYDFLLTFSCCQFYLQSYCVFTDLGCWCIGGEDNGREGVTSCFYHLGRVDAAGGLNTQLFRKRWNASVNLILDSGQGFIHTVQAYISVVCIPEIYFSTISLPHLRVPQFSMS